MRQSQPPLLTGQKPLISLVNSTIVRPGERISLLVNLSQRISPRLPAAVSLLSLVFPNYSFNTPFSRIVVPSEVTVLPGRYSVIPQELLLSPPVQVLFT